MDANRDENRSHDCTFFATVGKRSCPCPASPSFPFTHSSKLPFSASLSSPPPLLAALMSALPLTSVVDNTVAQLYTLYDHIGIPKAYQADLIADLDEKLRATCTATVRDAQIQADKLSEQIKAAGQAVQKAAQQLHNDVIVQQVS
jgi:hypothetical protein